MKLNIQPTEKAISTGMLVNCDGEARFSEAGLFAITGLMAYNAGAENQEHCATMIERVLKQARAGGLEDQMAHVIRWGFSEGINPLDESEQGSQLAVLCRFVARIIGPGRMKDVMDGRKSH